MADRSAGCESRGWYLWWVTLVGRDLVWLRVMDDMSCTAKGKRRLGKVAGSGFLVAKGTLWVGLGRIWSDSRRVFSQGRTEFGPIEVWRERSRLGGFWFGPRLDMAGSRAWLRAEARASSELLANSGRIWSQKFALGRIDERDFGASMIDHFHQCFRWERRQDAHRLLKTCFKHWTPFFG
jgi:hypothetical protein